MNVTAIERAKERRRALKSGMPRVNLSMVHTELCRVLPDRNALLERLPRDGVAAELGVAFGDFTRSIISINRPRELHLVDMWDSDRYRAGLERIKLELSESIASGQIHIHQGPSIEKLNAMLMVRSIGST